MDLVLLYLWFEKWKQPLHYDAALSLFLVSAVTDNREVLGTTPNVLVDESKFLTIV